MMVNQTHIMIFVNTLRFLVIVFLIILVFHLIFSVFYHVKYVDLFEIYISPDGHLEDAFRVFSVVAYGLIWLIVLIVSHLILLSNSKNIVLNEKSSIFIFAGSVIIILSWYLFHNTTVYREDNIVETASALIAVAAGLLFITTAWLNRGESVQFYLVWGAVFLFIGFEEISWGQRIFGWKTPDVWKEINEQNETNLHNLLNFLFLPIYFFVALFLAVIFLLSDFLAKIIPDKLFLKSFIPNRKYQIISYIFFFLSITSLIIGTEMSEEVYYFMAITFSFYHFWGAIHDKYLPAK